MNVRRRDEKSLPKVSIVTLAGACTFAFLLRGWLTDEVDLAIAPAVGSSYNSQGVNDIYNPLSVPRGKAVALPSVRVDDSNASYNRKIYGGKGDKPHLGGFTELDPDGVSPAAWKFMLEEIGVKSLIDVSLQEVTWCFYGYEVWDSGVLFSAEYSSIIVS